MRRLALILAALVLAFPVAGCGGGDDDDTRPGERRDDATPAARTDTGETGDHRGRPRPRRRPARAIAANGKDDLRAPPAAAAATRSSDAGSSGTVGPNLDDAKPDDDLVVERVTNGSGVMPSFADQLSEQEIKDVAAYVSSAAGS